MVGLVCTMSLLPAPPSDILELEVMTEYDINMYFGSIPKAMFSLFNLVLLAEYPEFMRPLFLNQPELFVVLLVLVFFSVFGVLNVLVGVVVENMMVATAELKN